MHRYSNLIGGNMFKIMSGGSAILDHQVKKEIAGMDARTTLKSKMKQAEHQITDKFISRRIDVNDARKNYSDAKRNYDRTAPETLTPSAQNTMWKRAKELKDEFMVGMLSHDELQPLKGIMVDGSMKYVVDWEKITTNRSVERNTDWYKRNTNKLAEFKNIMRHLAPDNPAASDVEKFRPRQRSV